MQLPKSLFAGLIVFFLPAGVITAQNSTSFSLSDYSEKTIYLHGANGYIKNNTYYSGHKLLMKEFSVSPGGLELYVRSRRNRNIALAVSLIGTAGSLYALLNRNKVDWRPFFWTSLGTGLIAAPINMTASKQLNQAVWLRNKDVLALPSGNPGR